MASKTERTRFTPTLISLAVASCFASGAAYAQLPTGAHSMTGVSSINTVGNTMTVTTNAARSIANWQSFSIGSNSGVILQQPGASSAMLNRVTGADPSAIMGTLQSNGRVYLINPAGIVFGASAQVDVAGLVASTLRLSDADFKANRLRFTNGTGAGSVVNEARPTQALPNAGIHAREGGEVYLVGSSVANKGLIRTPKGEVVLAAGSHVELVNAGTPNLRVEVRAPSNEVRNLGDIVAEAGRVGIYAGLIHQGAGATISANSAVAEGGRIVLKATRNTTVEAGSTITASGQSGGQVTIQSGEMTLVEGAVSATGASGKGGTVEVLGNLVALDGNASIDVSGATGGGTALVGGDFQGKNPNVQNAYSTYFGPNAKINADATGNGDGGTVIVWSDQATGAYGTISARGGKDGGDGGFVEVSGRGWLDFHAKVDTSAPKGRAGMLLLDPADVCIYNTDSATCPGGGEGSTLGFSAGVSSTVFFSNSTSHNETQIDFAAGSGGLKSILEGSGGGVGGSHVTVTTSNMSGGTGSITVSEDLSPYNSDKLFQLVAHNDINVDGSIENSGPGELRMYAGWNQAAAGSSIASIKANAFTPIKVIPNKGNINVNADIDVHGNTLLRAGNTITVAANKEVYVRSTGPGQTRKLRLEADNAVVVQPGAELLVYSGNGAGDTAIVEIVSGTGGITVGSSNENDTIIQATATGQGGVGKVAFSTAGNITTQNARIGAEGGAGGIASVIMGANGKISIGGGSIIMAGNSCCSSGEGTAAQITLIGNEILVDGESSIFAFGGPGSGTANGGAASVNLIAAAGKDLVGAADSSEFNPLTVPPAGPISIMGAEGVVAFGGSGQNGGKTALTMLAGGPLTIQDTFFVFAGGGFGSGESGNGNGGPASTFLGSLTDVNIIRSHVGASGGPASGTGSGGSGVTRVEAGGNVLVDGTGGSEPPLTRTLFASGGHSPSGTLGTGEIRITLGSATSQVTVKNDLIDVSGGERGEGPTAVFGPASLTFDYLARTEGGFSVNGADGAISAGSGNPPPFGFLVNNRPAVLGTNFFLKYAVIPETPPPGFDSQLVSSLLDVTKDVVPKNEAEAPTKEEKDKKKKEREC